ncbi:ABC transporter permease [Arenibacter sp. N53]|uniref:ABC transporter permease n=1 Tax=Arenibacter TaxID=178469 RepID=UPI000CD44F6F|nr:MULTISPECIES: ABC transporter permease [Arenibacter]MCM4151033.1 ABC transporter permease [Arenibacter sp. N53]
MLVFKEIIHRKFNFLMGLLAMITIVALVVAFYTITKATQDETRLLTRNMGFNVRIIPVASDMNQFWLQGYSDLTMSEKVVDKMIEQKSVNYSHLTATLHKRIHWRDKEIILSGISKEEREPMGSNKSKMIFAIPPGKVYLGYELAQQFNLAEGETITFFDKEFEVIKTLSEVGSEDDIRVYFDLATLQDLTNMKGRVNEVMALNCMCSTKNGDPLTELRKELAKIAPEAKVIMNSTIADARENQRKMTDKYFALLFPIILIICAIWLGSVAMGNVKDRTHEIGIMRALGFSAWKISSLFLQRAIVIGVVGSVLGFALGTLVSMNLGPKIFNVTMVAVDPVFNLLYLAVLLGPLFAVLASMLPIVWAVNQDSAKLLNEH